MPDDRPPGKMFAQYVAALTAADADKFRASMLRIAEAADRAAATHKQLEAVTVALEAEMKRRR